MFRRAVLVLGVIGAVVVAAGAGALIRRHQRARAEAVERAQPELAAASASAPVDSTRPTRPAPPTRVTSAASSPAPREPARAASPSVAPVLDESALMARLRDLGETDPALSLRLARDGLARFPDGPNAPERNWIVVKSLVNLERFDEARAEARVMVEKYPDDARAMDVKRHLLSNPP